MSAAQILGWVGTTIALGGYSWAVAKDRPRVFHFANGVGSIGIGISAAAAGAWPNLVLTVVFGLIGWVGVWQTRGIR